MLAGAGAAIRNFVQAYGAQLGFDPHNILLLDLAVPEKAYTTWQAGVTYHEGLLEKVRETPGVASVAGSIPGLPPDNRWLQPVEVVGRTTRRWTAEQRGDGRARTTSPYFTFRCSKAGRRRPRRSTRGARVAAVSKIVCRPLFRRRRIRSGT